jgi:sugar phosphate isomerase/epimerase
VFPGSASLAFEMASALGYDGVEVMVTAERVTQDADALAELTAQHGVPVLSVHSPCLLVSARVWSTDPLVKISRSVDLAERLGATVVVAHPPFVWQRAAAGSFVAAVAELSERTEVRIAIENMFPVRIAGALVNTYRPHWDPVPSGYPWYTLDLSHTAASGVDALEMADRMAGRLTHLHLADGSGAARDEHLVPGRGVVPCGPVLSALASSGYTGSVVLEVSTRGSSAQQREVDLAEALTFARWHLDEPPARP